MVYYIASVILGQFLAWRSEKFCRTTIYETGICNERKGVKCTNSSAFRVHLQIFAHENITLQEGAILSIQGFVVWG